MPQWYDMDINIKFWYEMKFYIKYTEVNEIYVVLLMQSKFS